VRGGVAGAGAAVLRPRNRSLASLVQWSYWLGWSPALAISAALIAEYVHGRYLPTTSPWVAWMIALGILALAAFVNHLGLRPSAWLQVALVAALVLPAAVLVAAPIVGGHFNADRVSLDIRGGWRSGAGISAFGGALFLAGWSAYGSEVALTYTPEYRRRSRDAVRAVFGAAAAVLVVCAVVPLLLLGGLGATALGKDPAASVLASGGAGSWVDQAAVPLLLISFALTLNLISASDARVLYQMGRSGEAWAFLGRLNARGAPENALLFDAGANATYLAVGLAVTGGKLSEVPTTLLTAACIGYFVSLILALAAAWIARRGELGAKTGYRAPRGFITLGLGLAAFNAALLLAAGSVWGWRNVGLGLLLLVAVALFGERRPGRRPEAVVEPGLHRGH
jgi:amino acid transporter